MLSIAELVAHSRLRSSLHFVVQEAHAVLAAHTPASAKQSVRDMEMRALFGSPTPLRLSTEFRLVSEPPTSVSTLVPWHAYLWNAVKVLTPT